MTEFFNLSFSFFSLISILNSCAIIFEGILATGRAKTSFVNEFLQNYYRRSAPPPLLPGALLCVQCVCFHNLVCQANRNQNIIWNSPFELQRALANLVLNKVYRIVKYTNV